MSTLVHEPLASDAEIVADADDRLKRGLAVLSVADSLTDPLALHLLRTSDIIDGDRVLSILHKCNFVIHRNTEWRLSVSARAHSRTLLAQYPELEASLNREMVRLSNPDLEGWSSLPSYLLEGAGAAYHTAAVDPEAGLRMYSELARSERPRVTWMSSRLAKEQEERGVLSAQSAELQFLKGMALYREGRMADSIGVLQPIAASKKRTIDVAISAHLVGRHLTLRSNGRDAVDGIKMLRRSRSIGLELNDVTHVIHVTHSLAMALLRGGDQKIRREAIGHLREALRLSETLGDPLSKAQILHSWGQALSQSKAKSEVVNAEGMLRRSLGIGEDLHLLAHQARVLMSLSRLVGRRDQAEAEGLRNRALELDPGMAQHEEQGVPSSRNPSPELPSKPSASDRRRRRHRRSAR